MTLQTYISDALRADVYDTLDFYRDHGADSDYKYLGECLGYAVANAYEAYDEYQALLVFKGE